MIATHFLETIFDRIKANPDITNSNIRISNFIPPDQSPPFVEIKTTGYHQAVGQKTATIHVNIRIVSAYCGDQELHQVQSNLVAQLTHQAFRDKLQRHIIQGRLLQNARSYENSGRIQIENMTLAFFMSPLH